MTPGLSCHEIEEFCTTSTFRTLLTVGGGHALVYSGKKEKQSYPVFPM